MTIYVTRNFGTFGKDIPGMPHQRFLRAPGRAGTIISGIQVARRFITKYRKPITHAGTLTAGAGVTGVGEDINETRNFVRKTLRSERTVRNRFTRGYKRASNHKCSCPRQRCCC